MWLETEFGLVTQDHKQDIVLAGLGMELDMGRSFILKSYLWWFKIFWRVYSLLNNGSLNKPQQ